MQLAPIFNAEDAEAAEERRGIFRWGNSLCLVSFVHTAFLCGSLRSLRSQRPLFNCIDSAEPSEGGTELGTQKRNSANGFGFGFSISDFGV